MAKGLEAERRQIEADEVKLKLRRARLAELERDAVRKVFDKSSLGKLGLSEVEPLLARIDKLGIAEVTKRLA